jgi:hypothetical protein
MFVRQRLRPRLLVVDAEARVDLLRSLHRLSEYYVTLAKHVLPVGRGSTHFTQYLFRQMAQSLSQFEVYASDDASAIDLEDDRLSPAGGALVAMTPTGDLDLSEPFVAQRVWANHSADLPLPCIRRVVGGQNGDAGFALVLEADLVLASGDWFEARFSWSTVSRTDLRSRYAT